MEQVSQTQYFPSFINFWPIHNSKWRQVKYEQNFCSSSAAVRCTGMTPACFGQYLCKSGTSASASCSSVFLPGQQLIKLSVHLQSWSPLPQFKSANFLHLASLALSSLLYAHDLRHDVQCAANDRQVALLLQKDRDGVKNSKLLIFMRIHTFMNNEQVI